MRFLSARLVGLLCALSASAADLPEGAGRDSVQSACTTCHTADRITALKLTEEGWRNTVRQMIEEGASFNPSDIEPIVAYLVKNLGAHNTPNNPAIPAQSAVASRSTGPVNFNRDIRPIMSRTCFRCHGPDVSSRMAGMRLDLRDEALKPKARGIPIVPGDPGKSEVVQRIFATDARVMPPASANRTLTSTEKETIRRWISEGARYEGHWAYQPVVRPAVPAFNGARNPIDRFIQTRLASEGLKLSPEADRRTLLRRVTLDLTGLAPEPAQIEAFVKNKSPDAYEKVVDRLLSSQAYAEHQAVPWLDAVRYADSAGYHSDGERPAWPYRDYVMRAFHDNKPFDQFTREQLAGDLLPSPTTEQEIASAYNRMGRTSAEGGLQPKEYWAKYGADRVRAIGANWLGSTFGCAECHDHKFDPILTKDFYAMKAFFADVKEEGLVADTGPDAFAPKMPVYRPGEKEKIDRLIRRIAAEQAALDARAGMMKEQRSQWEQGVALDSVWKFQIPTSVSAKSAKLTVDAAGPSQTELAAMPPAMRTGPGAVLVTGPNPDNETYTVVLKPGAGRWTYVGLEVNSDISLAGANVSRGADRFVLTEVTAEISGKPATFSLAYSATTPTTGYPAMAVIDGNSNTGWGFAGNAGRPFLMLRFKEPVSTSADSTLTVRLHHDSQFRRATIGKFRVALSSAPSLPDAPPPPGQLQGEAPAATQLQQALKLAEDKRGETQNTLLNTHFEFSVPELFPARLALATLESELSLLQGAVAQVMVTETMEPRETRLLPRGNWMDDSGVLLQPAIPEFLGKLDTGDRRATRLDLANWLVSPENPLTARVFVNRLWRKFFGTGLSRTLEDVGSQGEWPSHPELLDWLASEFVSPQFDNLDAHAWDIRHVIRTIVTSSTYKQSSLSTPELDRRDPDNRLLARQSRFRVDAEVVRDLALQISGLLVNQFGGPPARPYQPDAYLAALNFPKRDWSASRGDQLYRRGVYTMWQRTFLHPAMANFDAPSREETNVSRINSNTPLQALDLLNDPVYVETARAFGQRILQHGGTRPSAQIRWAFQQALGRDPDDGELGILENLYRDSAAQFKADPEAAGKLIKTGESAIPRDLKPVDLAAMMNVARAILNLHEVITRD